MGHSTNQEHDDTDDVERGDSTTSSQSYCQILFQRRSLQGLLIVFALTCVNIMSNSAATFGCTTTGSAPFSGSTQTIQRKEWSGENVRQKLRFEQLRERHLSHVIMPFFPGQLNVLSQNLRIWSEHKPCHPYDLDEAWYRHLPQLIFYLTNSSTELSPDFETDLMHVYHELPEEVQQCFHRPRVMFLQYPNGTKNDHVTGARIMFEGMLNGKATLSDADIISPYVSLGSYVLYMEPDLRPIQSGWASAVAEQVAPPLPWFWMMGSLPRGPRSRQHYVPNNFHINGNAIYNLGDRSLSKNTSTSTNGDNNTSLTTPAPASTTTTIPSTVAESGRKGELSAFYFEKVRPYVVAKHGDSANAYDTDFAEYLMDQNNFPNNVQHIAHLFSLTNLIQNMYQITFSAAALAKSSPETYLTHGGVWTP